MRHGILGAYATPVPGATLRAGELEAWTGPASGSGLGGVVRRFGRTVVCFFGDRPAAAEEPPAVASVTSWLAWARSAALGGCGAICGPDRVALWTDPLASCPAFFGIDGQRLVFGSRARWVRELLPGGLGLHRLEGARPLPHAGATVFPGVRAVAPGSVQRFRRLGRRWRTLPEQVYWRAPCAEITDLPRGRALVARELPAAVVRAAAGHDRVAVALSGGVDSTSVAALASRAGGRVSTFTVGSHRGGEFGPAAAMAEFLGTEHHELVMDAADLTSLLPPLIDALETWDPLTLQIVAPLAFLYRNIRRSGSVLLTGYGADLVFGSLVDPAVGEPAFEEAIRKALRGLARTHELTPALPAAAGLLVRHPFLSTPMVEAALAVRGRLEAWNGIVKYVLRCAAEEWLPFEAAWRKKVGIHEGSAMEQLLAECLQATRPQEQARRLRDIAEAMWREPRSASPPAVEERRCVSS